MKWGVPSSKQSSNGQRSYAGLGSQATFDSQSHLLSASSSHLPLPGSRSNSVDDEATTRPSKPLRLFKHKKENGTDDSQGSNGSSGSMTSSPSVNHVAPSPTSPLVTSFPMPEQLSRSVDSVGSHHMSISRSMNDIAFFARSPTTRDLQTNFEYSPTESFKTTFSSRNLSSRQDLRTSPSKLSVKQGWLNKHDSDPKKGSGLKSLTWKLQRAVLRENQLHLYKPPSDLGVKSFDFSGSYGKSNASQPVLADVTYTGSSKHPDLVIDANGEIISGSIEAICHEMLFGDDLAFVHDAILLLPLWADASEAFGMLCKVASVGVSSDRLAFVLSSIADKLGSMLLDDSIYPILTRMLEFLDDKQKDAVAHNMTTKKSCLTSTRKHHATTDAQNPMYSEYRPGLTVDGFLHVDLDLFAAQIHVFDLKIFHNWNPLNDFSLFYGSKYLFTLNNPLVSNSAFSHFLGATLARQIFTSTSSGVTSPSFVCNLLSRWILLGNILKQRGDMVGWLSIATIVCSPAICRLEAVWSLASLELIDMINREWAPVIFDVDRRSVFGQQEVRSESSHILAPDGIGKTYSKDWVVPYFGDVGVQCQESMADINKDNIAIYESRQELLRIQQTLERWNTYISTVENQEHMPPLEPPISALQECLYSLYAWHMSAPPLNALALMEMSLNYEPASIGQYAPFYSSQKSPLSNGSYSSILFTDVVPSYKLFAQKDLLEAGGLHHRKSNSTLKPKPSFERLVAQLPQEKAPSDTRQLRRASSFPPSRAGIQITGFSDLDAISRNRVIAFPEGHFLVRSVRDILNVGVSFYHVGNNLVLKSFKEDTKRSSRLSSVIIENPSKRISTGSRRLSAQFQPSAIESQFAEYRNSLPLVVNVVARSGTFDRLVDILVLGVEDFGSHIKLEDMGSLSKHDQTSLRTDMDIYTATFFATYKNFSTPTQLLECLRRRFIGARNASAVLQTSATTTNMFPDWNFYGEVDDHDCDWTFIAKVHVGILEALNVWVSEHYSDLVSELNLRESFVDFLRLINHEADAWCEKPFRGSGLIGYAETIETLSRKLRKSFVRRSYRPVEVSRWPVLPSNSASSLRFPDSSSIGIQRFCDVVDQVIGYVFKQIQLTDWLAVFEIFETQTVDPLKMFNNKVSPMTADDDVVIQDIFAFCSSLYCFKSDELMVSLLPKPVKNLFALRMNLVSWLVLHIADPALKKSARVKRMATLLQCISHSRIRMSVAEFGQQLSSTDETERGKVLPIPSLVESAIAAAIVRPESRQYTAAWIKAAHVVGKNLQQVNFLEEIIPSLPFNSEPSFAVEPLTPCMGWIFERIFEIVCYVPNMSVESQVMINFDKQRYIYNFLSKVLDMKSADVIIESENPAAFLLSSEIAARFDKRQVKEAAAKELKDLSLKNAKGLRAFQGLISLEQEKVRRDGVQKELVERQTRDALRNSYSRGGRLPISNLDKKAHKSSRFGGLLRAVRPLSMAFSSNMSPVLSDRSVSPMELPEVSSVESKHRPTLSINLASAVTTIPDDMIGMGVFKIVCEDATELLFQATTDEELDDWVRVCSAVRSAHLEKLDSTRAVPSASSVFGVPISMVCKREDTLVPSAVDILLTEIETRGVEEVGIYRVPGSLASVNALRRAIDSGEPVDMDDSRWYDINTVAGCLKLYLRELPEPLLTNEHFSSFTQVAKLADENDQVDGFASTVQKLPPSNYYLLKRIIGHLSLIAEHGDVNKMHAVNLAIVFSMSLLPAGSTLSMSSDLGALQTMLRTMITNQEQIFVSGFLPGTPSRQALSISTTQSFDLTDLDSSLPSPVPSAHSSKNRVNYMSSGNASPTKRESFQEVPVF
ncbi:hypothetical protein V1512DRAFT_245311 [Lipomyces arxii]|uniref:uncharacterized protein n=1 Tax=Lipomyces arxii TaxID=56418 RepID=UPI0034CEB739